MEETIFAKDGRLSRYLSKTLGRELKIKEIQKLGEGEHGVAFKLVPQIGKPLILKYFKATGRNLNFLEDRIREAHLIKRTSDLIDEHVKVLDIAYLSATNEILSHPPSEPLIIMEEAEGEEYFAELGRISQAEKLTKENVERLKKVVHALAKMHHEKGTPEAYQRYIKDWFSNGILELTNELKLAYPKENIFEIKSAFLKWEDTLYKCSSRCRKIHGELFPGTIRFNNEKLVLYDMRRFGYGEPADDYGSFIFNIILSSILAHGKLKEPFTSMVEICIEEYTKKVKDPELFTFLIPFMAYRALIVSNPKIVPLDPEKQKIILVFLKNLLKQKSFSIEKVNSLLK